MESDDSEPEVVFDWNDGFLQQLDNDLDHALALSLHSAINEEQNSVSSDGSHHLPSLNFKHNLKEDSDFALAVHLQEELNAKWEQNSTLGSSPEPQVPNHYSGSKIKEPISIVDAKWEVLDPVPNIHQLFLEFNATFFWGKLDSVVVRWSTRMTLCAGLCSYEGRCGLCSISLSQPLLKYRPRRDLVETLLHEMIHAYLFVTCNKKDHDAHGPEFLKHMHRINKSTGANITVYHNFHNEVELYRTHCWRCNGRCRDWKPYFGWVKRTMNRAPSANDTWWAAHQAKCGGTFTKVSEPENYKKRNRTETKTSEDIRGFFTPPKVRKTANTNPVSGINQRSNKSDPKEKRPIVPFSGKGFVLGTGASSTNAKRQSVLLQEIPSFKASTGVDSVEKGLPSNSKDNQQLVSSFFISPIKKDSTGKGIVLGAKGAVETSPIIGRPFPALQTPLINARNSTKTSQKKVIINGQLKMVTGKQKNGISTAVRNGGSNTIVLNNSSKTKQSSEKVEAKYDVPKTSGLTVRGHNLDQSLQHDKKESPSPSSAAQKSIETFFEKTESKKSPSQKYPPVFFNSDSEEEEGIVIVNTSKNIHSSKTDKTKCESQRDNNSPISKAQTNTDGPVGKLVHCPVCGSLVDNELINFHLDSCLKRFS